MQRKSIFILALLLSFALIISACAPVAAPSADGGGDAASGGDDVVKIGVITPLTEPGDTSAGQLVQRAAELAVEYVNNE